MDLVLNVELGQREQKANAKLEASLKKKKLLNLAKALEEDMAAQQIVAPENMTALVNSLVDKQINRQGKQKQKALLKTALQKAQKQSLGGDKVAKTPPGKLNPGNKQIGNLRKVSFGMDTAPNLKRAKKASTQSSEKDYKSCKCQQRAPNPYAGRGRGRGQSNTHWTQPPSNFGWGNSPGRGCGRGHTCGGFSNGQGRRRGWH